MAKTYQVTGFQRMINSVFRWLTRRGLGAGFRYVLTVPGRHSGELRSVPVDVIEVAGARWLVAAYGIVAWVHNVRAAGRITLSRAGTDTAWLAEEVTGPETAAVLRAYLAAVPVTRPYFDVTAESSDAEFAAQAVRHPVFRLSPAA
ncbi:nitroreductase/quinone reductase family protein [Microlunatus sp. GCM10028923]|uniref:nitroreductase/quinone reductase family protein n=1 Tax=Microlunatus sp. GCM10028923 TaxID=3273400 RepID=UPI00360A04BA